MLYLALLLLFINVVLELRKKILNLWILHFYFSFILGKQCKKAAQSKTQTEVE